MNVFQGGAVVVETSSLSPLAMRELVEALARELTEFALQHEKVLEKLDVRAARRARRAATDLRACMRSALESGSADDSALSPILEECHEVLSGASMPESEALPPAPSPVSEVRRLTRKMQAVPPSIAPMYGEDEPTLPGHRRATLASLVSEDDEDDDKTAAGLPDEVVSQYLREVCRATG